MILICDHCRAATTLAEAEQRVFSPLRCGECGSTLFMASIRDMFVSTALADCVTNGSMAAMTRAVLGRHKPHLRLHVSQGKLTKALYWRVLLAGHEGPSTEQWHTTEEAAYRRVRDRQLLGRL